MRLQKRNDDHAHHARHSDIDGLQRIARRLGRRRDRGARTTAGTCRLGRLDAGAGGVEGRVGVVSGDDALDGQSLRHGDCRGGGDGLLSRGSLRRSEEREEESGGYRWEMHCDELEVESQEKSTIAV